MTDELRKIILGEFVPIRLGNPDLLIPIPPEDKRDINCELKDVLAKANKIERARFKCIERYIPETMVKIYEYQPLNEEAKKLREQTLRYDKLHNRLDQLTQEMQSIQSELQHLVIDPYVYSK